MFLFLFHVQHFEDFAWDAARNIPNTGTIEFAVWKSAAIRKLLIFRVCFLFNFLASLNNVRFVRIFLSLSSDNLKKKYSETLQKHLISPENTVRVLLGNILRAAPLEKLFVKPMDKKHAIYDSVNRQ